MNDKDFSKFLTVLDAGQKVAQMLAQPALRPIASFLANKFVEHVGATYPAEAQKFAEDSSRELKGARGARTPKRPMEEAGPILWEALHRRALKPVADRVREMAWLVGEYRDRLRDELPCPFCAINFLNYVNANPPDFENYFAWSVELHNSVTGERAKAATKAGRPFEPVFFTTEGALKRWGE